MKSNINPHSLKLQIQSRWSWRLLRRLSSAQEDLHVSPTSYLDSSWSACCDRSSPVRSAYSCCDHTMHIHRAWLIAAVAYLDVNHSPTVLPKKTCWTRLRQYSPKQRDCKHGKSVDYSLVNDRTRKNKSGCVEKAVLSQFEGLKRRKIDQVERRVVLKTKIPNADHR